MRTRRTFLQVIVALSLVAAVATDRELVAAEQKSVEPVRRVAGVLIDKKPEVLTIKADGDAEALKYEFSLADKKLVDELKEVFDACRGQVTFKQEGDSRKLVGIKRQISKLSGTFTGDVVKVHNDFWIEVKPKIGLADAFALGAEYWQDKVFMQGLKDLLPGESVTITCTTDFERHRIKTLRENPPTVKKDAPTKAGLPKEGPTKVESTKPTS